MQFQRRAIVLTCRQCPDGHGRAAGGHQNRNLPGFDPPVHLVNRRLQGALDEGLQERTTLGGDWIVLDEIPLQPHRTHPGAGEGSGIASIGQDQFRRSATDVQKQVGAISEGHTGQHPEIDQTGLLRATDQIHIHAKAVLDALEKLPPIGSLPHGAGGCSHDLLNVVTDRKVPETPQRFVSALHTRRREFAAIRIPLPESCGRLLRLFDAEGAQGGVHGGHQQVGGISADVDGGHPAGLDRRSRRLRPCRSL